MELGNFALDGNGGNETGTTCAENEEIFNHGLGKFLAISLLWINAKK